MANLASGDWTVAFRRDRYHDTIIKGRKKYTDLKLTLASGKTFPKAGVPMPGAGSVGMVRNLDHYILAQGPIDVLAFTTGITTASAGSVMWSIGVTDNKLYAYHVKAATGTGLSVKRMTSGDAALKKHIFYVTAVGW